MAASDQFATEILDDPLLPPDRGCVELRHHQDPHTVSCKTDS